MSKSSKLLGPKNPYGLPDNPKDLVGQTKLDLSVIPDSYLIALALAFYEGALKYGRFNWRMRPVKASVYISACQRHILKWGSGEEVDKTTGVHHLAYATCCLAIMYDAQKYGTLMDDRAPRGRLNPNISKELDTSVVRGVKHLQKLFKDQKPKQFTIADNIFDQIGGQQSLSSIGERRSRVVPKRSKKR